MDGDRHLRSADLPSNTVRSMKSVGRPGVYRREQVRCHEKKGVKGRDKETEPTCSLGLVWVVLDQRCFFVCPVIPHP